MTTKRFTYLFSNENDFNRNDSDKIYFYGWWGSCSEFDLD